MTLTTIKLTDAELARIQPILTRMRMTTKQRMTAIAQELRTTATTIETRLASLPAEVKEE